MISFSPRFFVFLVWMYVALLGPLSGSAPYSMYEYNCCRGGEFLPRACSKVKVALGLSFAAVLALRLVDRTV